jgi:hypothetical protein
MFPLGILLFLALAVTVTSNSSWATIIPDVIFAVALLNATLIWFAPFMARRSATRALGIKVTSANYPPNDEPSYEAWCRENHVEPNSAMTR